MADQAQQCYIGNETATATCTTCQKPICAEHTAMGQPFISLSELGRTAISAPSMLFGPPLDEVPYCPTCREELTGRRTVEQMKALFGLLILIGLVVAGIYILLI